MADERLQLSATIVDRASGPLRDIGRAMQSLGGDRHFREMSRHSKEMHRTFQDMSRHLTHTLKPAIEGVAASAAGVTAAIVGLGALLRKMSNERIELFGLSQTTKLPTEEILRFQRAMNVLGQDKGAAESALRGFAGALVELQARAGDPGFQRGLQRFDTVLSGLFGPNGGYKLYAQVMAQAKAGDYAGALKSEIDALNYVAKLDPALATKLAEAFGLGGKVGELIKPLAQELERQRGVIQRELGYWESLKWNQAFVGLQTALGNLNVDVIKQLIGPMTSLADAVRKFVDANSQQIGDAVGRAINAISTELGKITGEDVQRWTDNVKSFFEEIGRAAGGIQGQIHATLTDIKDLINLFQVAGQLGSGNAKGAFETFAQRQSEAYGEESDPARRKMRFEEWLQAQRRLGAMGKPFGGRYFGNFEPPRKGETEEESIRRQLREQRDAITGGSKEGSEKGTEEGSKKGVLDGLRQFFHLQSAPGGGPGGGGGGDGVTQAAYHPPGMGGESAAGGFRPGFRGPGGAPVIGGPAEGGTAVPPGGPMGALGPTSRTPGAATGGSVGGGGPTDRTPGGSGGGTVGGDVHSGRGSWFSQFSGKFNWRDRGDKPGSNALGVPDWAQGIALPSRKTLGQWFDVTGPGGQTQRLQQTDVGPGKRTGRGIDISAAAAERFGFSPKNFPTDSPFSWRAAQPPPSVAGLSPRDQAVAALRGPGAAGSALAGGMGGAGPGRATSERGDRIPGHVLARAHSLVSGGASSSDLQNFMRSQGYPMAGAWCGEFTASVVKSAGLAPPKGAAVASNWMRWGEHVDPREAQAGDVAVRRRSRFGGPAVPGRTGSHVGLVESVDAERGRFGLLAGNQGRPVVGHGLQEYEFRRARIDKSLAAQTQMHKVEGNAHLQIDVNAPRGTRPRNLRYGGLFKKATLNRSEQMPMAADWEASVP